MIPKKTTMKSCRGKKAITDCELRNHYGCIQKGSLVTIISSCNYGMTVQTNPCPLCGVSLTVTHVGKDCLTLINPDSPES